VLPRHPGRESEARTSAGIQYHTVFSGKTFYFIPLKRNKEVRHSRTTFVLDPRLRSGYALAIWDDNGGCILAFFVNELVELYNPREGGDPGNCSMWGSPPSRG